MSFYALHSRTWSPAFPPTSTLILCWISHYYGVGKLLMRKQPKVDGSHWCLKMKQCSVFIAGREMYMFTTVSVRSSDRFYTLEGKRGNVLFLSLEPDKSINIKQWTPHLWIEPLGRGKTFQEWITFVEYSCRCFSRRDAKMRKHISDR